MEQNIVDLANKIAASHPYYIASNNYNCNFKARFHCSYVTHAEKETWAKNAAPVEVGTVFEKHRFKLAVQEAKKQLNIN